MAQQTLKFIDKNEDAHLHPKTLEKLVVGRSGRDDERNEDSIIIQRTKTGTILAAVDGMTCLTDWRTTKQGWRITTGKVASDIAGKYIQALTPGMTFADLVRAIVAEWAEARTRLGVPDGEVLGAVFCIYVPWDGPHGSFWQFGDCGWGYAYHDGKAEVWKDSLNGKMAANSHDADVRSWEITGKIKDMGQDYRGMDAATVAALAKLGWDAMQARRKRDRDYSWTVDPEKAVASRHMHEKHELVARPTRVVVVTDGWNYVPPTLEAGIERQDELRFSDRLMIGLNPYGLKTAKGFVGFDGTVHPFTDDVGYVGADY